MIDKECFTPEWISGRASELQYPDKNLIEKVIRAFSLLDMLSASGCPFHFKGGSALMLLLKDRRHRLSIDIDIICPPGTNIEDYLKDFKDYGFIDFKPIERLQRGTLIPKSHSKFFYQVSYKDDLQMTESILLDVLNEDCHYEEVLEVPVESPFIKTVGNINKVKVPSIGDILGDKLTAYAPNTTGIPYIKNDRDMGMEIIKQVYDIARLYEKVDTLERTASSFEKIAEVELSYRSKENNTQLIYEDIRNTSLCFATNGKEGSGDFEALQRGVSRVKSMMFNNKYTFEDALIDTSRAAYIATLLERGLFTIDKYSGNLEEIREMVINNTLPHRLTRLKRYSPEAFYYWSKTSQLL